MSGPAMTNDVEIEDFSDDLADEALDRQTDYIASWNGFPCRAGQ